MASLGSVEWIPLGGNAVTPGDVVSADAGGMPIYRVVAVSDGEALLQDDLHPAPCRMPLNRLHWKAHQASLSSSAPA